MGFGLAWALGTLLSGWAQTFPAVVTNATWSYFKGTAQPGGGDPTAWRQLEFGAGSWLSGRAPFVYGEPGLTPGVLLEDMQNRYTTVFFRTPFQVTNAAEVAEFELTAACDDGFIAWINGQEVARANVPAGEPTLSTLASSAAPEPVDWTGYPVTEPAGVLRTGTNLLAVQVFNVSAGSSDLVFDAGLTLTLKTPEDPRVVAVEPAPDAVLAQLTSVTVTFSRPVRGVDAGDLWVNEVPCTGVSGGGTTYTFTLTPPAYGEVQCAWDMRAGIQDWADPPNAFNPTGPGARWVYALRNPSAPRVMGLNPPADSTVRRLIQVEVFFDRPVVGVDATDLTREGVPATRVSGVAAGPYLFEFAPAAAGRAQLQWGTDADIVDALDSRWRFEGGAWGYTVDPGLRPPEIRITEFMAENVNGVKDEEGDAEDWIEIYNGSDRAVNLEGWTLTDDAGVPGRWVFPRVSLAPRQYLVVFASGKDRRATSAGARLHTNFKLSLAGEYLGLFNAESPREAMSEFAPAYPEQRNDHSYGRDLVGTWRSFAQATPGAANGSSALEGMVSPVHFSVERGFFQKPFALSLATPTPGATIRYTLDGSVPTLTNGVVYGEPLMLQATRIVRAAAFRADRLPSRVTTHTYLFNLPVTRRHLPALSLVTASNHLYGRSGIMEYNPRNTLNHGLAWERPVSVELIRPEDNGGFQADCGLRIQGGGYIRGLYNYRSASIPESKYSFRLYFRGDYGPGRLEYPLFPGVPVASFDTIVLRAGMNDATNPFLRDELARQVAADVGQVAARGTFVNLFLNGVYKGYYNPTERIDPDFLQTWHGGGERWDVLAAFSELREGDLVAWNALRSYARNNNLTLATKYAEIERQLDTTNFVEYLLPLIYADTDDWPHNNWRAARERLPGSRFRFYVWDAEWSFGYNNSPSHNTIAGQLSNLAPPWGGTEIQDLFLRLKASPEFRLLFADRVHRHFFAGGALTDERITQRYEQLKRQIAPTIPGFNDTIGTSWIRNRRRYLTNHFASAGLLASSNAPVLRPPGGRVARGGSVELSAGTGTIYYTTNGVDPRVRFSGDVAPEARTYVPGTPLSLSQSSVICARTRWSTNWSALTEAAFQVEESGIPLRFAEIMYHPPGGEAYEYLELINASLLPIELSGISLEGVTFRFADGVWLGGGERLVLASQADPPAFARRYPQVQVAGYYGGALANGGERLALRDPQGRVITAVEYGDRTPWPEDADGGGFALEVVDLEGEPRDAANWRASAQPGGSPGASPAPAAPPRIRLNEIAAFPAATPSPGHPSDDWIELHNPGAEGVPLEGWSLSDRSATRRFVFPRHLLEGGGYLVVHCSTAVSLGPLNTGFTLDPQGDGLDLRDPANQRVDAVTFGPQAQGFTLGRLGEDAAWGLADPTPGGANEPAVSGPVTQVVINEFQANALPGGTDWIELFNRDAALPVVLQGLVLGTSNAVSPLRLPAFIGPRGYALLPAEESAEPHTLDFRLPAARGWISLTDARGVELDRIGYTNALEGVSTGRLPDGSSGWVAFPWSASPGAANYLTPPLGPQIHEFMARNLSTLTNMVGRTADWIEIHNPLAESLDLAGFSLSVQEREPGQWVFPAGTTVLAGGYVLVWCDDASPPSGEGGRELHCGRALRGEGGGIHLFDRSGKVLDAVLYGFQLPDLTVGRSPEGWSLLAKPTPGSANAPRAALGDAANLRLNEWFAEGAGDDWLEVYNRDALPVSLGGLVLTDDPSLAGQTNHVVPGLSFVAPHGWVTWQADGQTERGPDHLPFSLDGFGETLRLYGANAAILDAVDYRVQMSEVSEGRFPDGEVEFTRFPVPSPASANCLPHPTVVIHELLTHPVPPLEAAIELRNEGTQPVDLGGWALSDDRTRPAKYRLPSPLRLEPGGFAVLYAREGDPAGWGSAITLAPTWGGELMLSEPRGEGGFTGYGAWVAYGPAAPGVSFGRVWTTAGADFVPLRQRTFGVDLAETVEEFRRGRGAPNAPPRVGPLVISEIMTRPIGVSPAGVVESAGLEYLELHNLMDEALPLGAATALGPGWRLRGGVEFAFPAAAAISARGYALVVPFDPVLDGVSRERFRVAYRLGPEVLLYGPFAGRLANEGETLMLEQTEGSRAGAPAPYLTCERIRYQDRLPWPVIADRDPFSLQRMSGSDYGNEPQAWRAALPTPGRANFLSEDGDQDGLPDDWEWAYGLNPQSGVGDDGPQGDPDRDGLPNLEEFRHGSRPQQLSLRITSVRSLSGTVRLGFNVAPGLTYAIEYRDALGIGGWQTLTHVLPAPNAGLVEIPLQMPTGTPARFFRVRFGG